MPKLTRCEWSEGSDLEIRYHDEEWGAPLHDDQKLFEFILLEGAQAGLSWITILRKRENYRKAFDGFDAEKIARYRKGRTRKLMEDAGIVRNRLKIASAVGNAKAFLKVRKEFGSFDRYIWGFVEKPKRPQKTSTTFRFSNPFMSAGRIFLPPSPAPTSRNWSRRIKRI